MPTPTFADYQRYRQLRAQEGGERPEVTVVTVSLNASATIERTIRSVQQQIGPVIEHVLVDGGSTDGTCDIINRLKRPHDFCLVESDRGISDAFNKGVALARGRFIQILNADDWLSDDQIACAISALRTTGADFAYGDLTFYENGKPTFRYVGEKDYVRAIHRRMPVISHPTVLARIECFERVGLFDLGYRQAMDYDWLLRLHRSRAVGTYDSRILGHMTHEGVSNRLFRRTVDEVREIVIRNGRNPGIARLEADWRYWKTKLSLPIKQHARPIYNTIRSAINPAYWTP